MPSDSQFLIQTLRPVFFLCEFVTESLLDGCEFSCLVLHFLPFVLQLMLQLGAPTPAFTELNLHMRHGAVQVATRVLEALNQSALPLAFLLRPLQLLTHLQDFVLQSPDRLILLQLQFNPLLLLLHQLTGEVVEFPVLLFLSRQLSLQVSGCLSFNPQIELCLLCSRLRLL